MADSALFVGWNQPARGREAGAVAAFGEGVQYFGELAARGEIESFEPFFLTLVTLTGETSTASSSSVANGRAWTDSATTTKRFPELDSQGSVERRLASGSSVRTGETLGQQDGGVHRSRSWAH